MSLNCICGKTIHDFQLIKSKKKNVPAGLTQVGGEEIELFKCKSCNSVSIKHIRNIEKSKADYSNIGKYYKSEVNSLRENRYRVRIDSLITNFFKNKVDIKENQYPSILEIGFGDGRILEEINKKIKCNLYGLEQDPSRSEVAHDYASIEIADNIFESKLSKLKFDVIYSVAVLEHVEQPQLFIKRLSEMLNTNGILILQYPNIECITAKIGVFQGYWDMLFEPGHICIPSKKAILSTLRMANIKLLSRKTCTIRSRGRFPLISNRSYIFELRLRNLLDKSKLFRSIYCMFVDICDIVFGGETVIIVGEKI